MVDLRLDDGCLSRLRIAWDPLIEIFASVALLVRHQSSPQFPYRSWLRHASHSLSRGRGTALLAWAATWPAGTLPQFLATCPRGARSAGLDEILADLGAVRPDVVRLRVRDDYPDRVPPAFERFANQTEAALAQLVEATRDYAQGVLAPYWSVVCDTAEQEVLRRARVLAADGVDVLLSKLHSRVQWSRPTLTLSGPQAGPVAREPTRLHVAPLIFLRDQVIAYGLRDGSLFLRYQSGGAASLAMPLVGDDVERDDGLSLLLGKSRAAMVRALQVPSTTTALAGRLALASSTVSEHLNTLVSAQIVARQRRGNRVYYGLTERGVQLLQALQDGDPSVKR